MRQLPKQVSIGGKWISVRLVADMESWGEYHHDLKQIWISSKCLSKSSLIRETMRHEMLHAALSISGVGFMETYSEEAVVRCMDEIFFPAFDKFLKQITPQ